MKKKITYVIGHKNPDTDSICSAIGLAALKRAGGEKNVVAARAGAINPQTAFILDYFTEDAPVYLSDVRPRARDLMNVDVVSVTSNTPLLKVMDLMREKSIRFVPVTDSGGKLEGVITLMDLARSYSERMEAGSAREVTTTLAHIVETLGGELILDSLGEELKTLSVFVGAMSKDSFTSTLGEKDASTSAVIVGDRVGIQISAIEMGVALLVVTGGFSVSDEVREAAAGNGVSLVVSPHDTATTALFIRLSSPASSICDVDFESCAPSEYAADLKYRLSGTNGLIVLDDDSVMQGIITKSNLLGSSGVSLILVDHNELSQAVDGAENVTIAGVVDHHRIGNFQTAEAIPFTCDPVGSTSTLVAELYRQRAVEIRKNVAGLLLGGLLSDTVILKSPTTTDRDREIVLWLEERTGLKHQEFGQEIFAATSSIKKLEAADVISADHKVFEAKGKQFGIGQIETVGFIEFEEEKARLLAELAKVKDKMSLELSALLVTDIVYGTSLLLVAAENRVLYSLGYQKVSDNLYELKDVISRKKQVVPHLLGVFNEIY
ncbi:MAG: putative manganese-dependent inorganic diphosphatase [Thermodesulfobacteriota bacterium]